MILHIVPVGLSIITNLDGTTSKAIRANPATYLNDRVELRKIVAAQQTKLKRAPGSHAEKSVSAEIASLTYNGESRAYDPYPNAGHNVLFLASKSPDSSGPGELAAMMNLMALELAGLNLPPDYIPERDAPCSDGVLPLPAGIVAVPGLEPASGNDFKQTGIANIAGLMAKVVSKLNEERGAAAVFHLSGGFGATIPFLVFFAELLQAAVRSKATVRAQMIWEKADVTVDIPLRPYNLEHLRAELNKKGDGQYGDGYLARGKEFTALGTAVDEFLREIMPRL